MKLKIEEQEIKFEKVFSTLDLFVLDFINILNELNIKYVIVSGYVAILFGRNRTSEDVDIFIEPINKRKFHELWEKLSISFECIITSKEDNAFDNYLSDGFPLRFSKIGSFIPNIELKYPKNELGYWTLQNKIKVIVNNKTINISPFELQIPYKLYLGSPKDIEDAKYLYIIFKESLDRKKMDYYIRELGQEANFRRYLE